MIQISCATVLFITGCVFLWSRMALNRIFSIDRVTGLFGKFPEARNISKKGLGVSLVPILASQVFLASPTFAESYEENIEREIGQPLWKELPRRITRDIKYLPKTPGIMDRKDWLKVIGIAGATGLLIAYDDELLDSVESKEETGGFVSEVKPLGDAKYTAPALLGIYAIGFLFESEREKETAIRSLEALTITGLTTVGIQAITGRERPEEGGEFGWFEYGHFPSGHAAMAFALAPIFDHQYCRIEEEDSNPKKFVKYLGKAVTYGLPSVVAYERLRSNSHHPSDVFVSMVLGLSVGSMVNRQAHEEQKNWGVGLEVRQNLAGFRVSFCW